MAKMESYSMDEVAKHSSEDSAWLVNKGRVFDVTEFTSHHPGGRNVLLGKFGQDVTDIMEDSRIHKHTANAYKMMNKYCIGTVENENEVHDNELNMEGYKENELVDWSKPMVAQVGRLGREYMKWVHSPVNRPLRLFGPDVVEFFSKTPWYMVPVLWLPVVLYLSTLGLKHLSEEVTSFSILTNMYSIFVVFVCVFLFGTFLWTLVEYILHRYLFHITPPDDSPFWITFHFFIHGQHHKVPFDSGRLVFPPVAASVFATAFYTLFVSVLPYGVANTLFSGGLFGYIMYDCIHYYLHHGSPNHGSYFHKLKSYHVSHHFEDPKKGYGISSKIWDFPFNTAPVKLN